MIRNCIKLGNKTFVSNFLTRQSEPLKRTIFLRPVISPSLLELCTVQNQRFKSKSSRKGEKFESDSDSYENSKIDEVQDKHTKILKVNVTSLRVDAILKTSLGIARNKIEQLFYESKIRLNGDKIQKKSAGVKEGDEIDLIKGPDLKNPNFMTVARVEILTITGNEDSISVKVRRSKSLTVDAYK